AMCRPSTSRCPVIASLLGLAVVIVNVSRNRGWMTRKLACCCPAERRIDADWRVGGARSADGPGWARSAQYVTGEALQPKHGVAELLVRSSDEPNTITRDPVQAPVAELSAIGASAMRCHRSAAGTYAAPDRLACDPRSPPQTMSESPVHTLSASGGAETGAVE